MDTYTREAEQQAQVELQEEAYRAAVDAAKERIKARQGRPWWYTLIPFTLKIERR